MPSRAVCRIELKITICSCFVTNFPTTVFILESLVATRNYCNFLKCYCFQVLAIVFVCRKEFSWDNEDNVTAATVSRRWNDKCVSVCDNHSTAQAFILWICNKQAQWIIHVVVLCHQAIWNPLFGDKMSDTKAKNIWTHAHTRTHWWEWLCKQIKAEIDCRFIVKCALVR